MSRYIGVDFSMRLFVILPGVLSYRGGRHPHVPSGMNAVNLILHQRQQCVF